MGGESATTPSFSLLNRGKKSVVLDLKRPEGQESLKQLLGTADVLVTNLRPKLLQGLGLEPEIVLASHPSLIYASITGLGLRGRESGAAVYDVGGFWARSGVIAQLSAPSEAPFTAIGGFGDFVTALSMYAAIVTALLERERTGLGRLVETSLLQTGAYMASGDLAVQAAHGSIPPPRPRAESRTPLVNSYRSSDGRWFYLTCIEAERHFPKVCRAIGLPDLVNDVRFGSARGIRKHSRELIAVFDEAFAKGTLEQWRARFAECDVWWQPAARPAEVLADPQLEANGMLQPVWDGAKRYPMITAPFRVDQGRDPLPAPALGEHNEEVLGKLRNPHGVDR